jgi:hypothetical protein
MTRLYSRSKIYGAILMDNPPEFVIVIRKWMLIIIVVYILFLVSVTAGN